jgi:hypothetical protein
MLVVVLIAASFTEMEIGGAYVGLAYDVGHPIGLCARQKPLSTGGKRRWRTPRSCRVATCGRRGHHRRPALFHVALRVECPRVDHDERYIMYPLAICDKRAQYVGILRQSCKERKKKWSNVPPSCRVATRGRRSDQSPRSANPELEVQRNAENEADTRAKMLIYLLENGLYRV